MKAAHPHTQHLIIISGPTASGKSSLGIDIAKKINGIVINADSKQVYKELPIGTAQPIPDKRDQNHWEVGGVKHYLYGYRSIRDPLNLHQYQKDVYAILGQVSNPIPILLGGSGLYIDAVINNYKLNEHDLNISRTKREDLMKMRVDQLQELLGEKIDDLNLSDRSNPHRLVRMIERGGVRFDSGTPLSNLHIYLDVEKTLLNRKIEARTKTMLEQGLEEEATRFKKEILRADPNLKIIGYQEFMDYFLGKIGLSDVEDLINLHTRQYVKRQKTWFKRVQGIKKIETASQAMSLIGRYLNDKML